MHREEVDHHRSRSRVDDGREKTRWRRRCSRKETREGERRRNQGLKRIYHLFHVDNTALVVVVVVVVVAVAVVVHLSCFSLCVSLLSFF